MRSSLASPGHPRAGTSRAPSDPTVRCAPGGRRTRIKKRGAVVAAMLGVVLSFAFPAAAEAEYWFNINYRCHATGLVNQNCIVGSPVTFWSPDAPAGARFDWDPDGGKYDWHPTVFNSPTATFTYNEPQPYSPGAHATDGSDSWRQSFIHITDPDGIPDPNSGPAFIRHRAGLSGLLSRTDGTCTLSGSVTFTARRSWRYAGSFQVEYRRRGSGVWRPLFRRPVRARRSGRAAYEIRNGEVRKVLDLQSGRIRRLLRQRVHFRVPYIKQRVEVGGRVVYRSSAKYRLRLSRCNTVKY